jgi:hypothetical protein
VRKHQHQPSQETLIKTPLKLSELASFGAVMRKTAFTLTVMLTISIISGLQFIGVAEANYIPLPSLWVTSPNPHQFSEFEGDVPLNVELDIVNSSDALESTVISYSVDGADNVSFTNLEQHSVFNHPDGSSLVIVGETIVRGLSVGNHTVIAYAKTPEGDVVFSEAVSFGVKAPPSTLTPEPDLSIDPNFSLYTGLALLIVVVVVAVFLLVRKHNQ